MTFPQGYHIKTNSDFIIKQANLNIYSLGIQKKKTNYGNKIKVYNIERTLCDILRPHQAADIQIISEAFKNYVQSQRKDIPKLSEYAKILRVEKKIRTYLEVLL